MNIRNVMCALALAAAGALAAVAQEAEMVTTLAVNLTSGAVELFSLPQQPEVTFSGAEMTVTSTIATATYKRSEVASFDFVKAPLQSGIAAVEGAAFTLTYLGGNEVIMTGSGLTSATVADLQGRTVLTARAADGAITVNLTNLPAGAYIVAPEGHRSVKILKK